tara:strand:+ start:530 stop:763 length:234 start_codon:yes stop_codon:yes gene_type:complete
LQFVLQHRIDRLSRLLEERQCYVDVLASFGLIAQQVQDKCSVPMQISLIRRLVDGLITAFGHQLEVVHLEVPQATAD